MYLLILIDWYGTLSCPAASSCSCSGKSSLHCMYLMYICISVFYARWERDIKRQHARQGIPRRGACKAYKALKQEQGSGSVYESSIHQPIQTLSSHVLLRSFSQIFYILPNYSWLIIMNIMIFFPGWNLEYQKPQATGLCVCVFCFVLWCNTLPATQKIFILATIQFRFGGCCQEI